MKGSRSMQQITTIGLDLAKQVFQVHGAETDGSPVISRKLRRADVLDFFKKLSPCLVDRSKLELHPAAKLCPSRDDG
jgi:hypothetical protein